MPTKPKLLVKAVNAWVRSAFGNVFLKRSIEHKPQPEDILPLGVVHSHFSFTAIEVKRRLTVDEDIVK